ncbi:transposase family protein [Nonomuraea sp. NPDC050680]|uniref:helix-turn-helix domain-containing protein n=1 Tax=Nonomuraea sp. NPDC050680 TaxID=3154630 RepID=UPI0033F3024F
MSRSTLNYVAGLIRRHRKTIGSTWRLLNPGQQALLVLVYLRKGETFPQLGAGFGVSTTTAWRYVEETVMLLSARSPKLDQALRKAKRDGLHYLVLDGTLIHIKRANRSHARLRGPGERANAQLKSWKILRKLRCSPSKAGHLCKAIAVLQNHRAAQVA